MSIICCIINAVANLSIRPSTTFSPRPVPRIAGALGGCLMLAIAMPANNRISSFLNTGGFPFAGDGKDWWLWGRPLAAALVLTVLSLTLLRFWPHLIVFGGLLWLPWLLLYDKIPLSSVPFLAEVGLASTAVVLIGVLAAAQSLIREGRVGWGAAIAGSGVGAQLFGATIIGSVFEHAFPTLVPAQIVLAAVAMAAALAAVVARPKGDPVRDGDGWGWPRLRLVVAGGLAVLAGVLPPLVTDERLASILDETWGTLIRFGDVALAVVGISLLVGGVLAAVVAGGSAAAGALTVALGQIAIAAPMLLAAGALTLATPVRWGSALAGVVAGAAAAATRWRVPFAASGAVLSATALFVVYAGTRGQPAKLAEHHLTVPGAALMFLLCASTTVLVGGAATVLARRKALPAVVGPVAVTLVVGGQLVLQLIYDGRTSRPLGSYLNSVSHITTSAVLLLVAAAALVGLQVAEAWALRRTERRAAETISRQAAAAERERLARPIHDGVLQVLALVERYGPELGGQGQRLADLASEQNASLRRLIATEAPPGSSQDRHDVRLLVAGLSSPTTNIAVPAEPVMLPAHDASELYAAIAAALDNVHRHAGPSARAWVLIEEEPDEVRISIRDDGGGIPEGRLVQARGAGRLGVAQSMIGRIKDLGGSTEITSRPGEGTEVEFTIPRRTS